MPAVICWVSTGILPNEGWVQHLHIAACHSDCPDPERGCLHASPPSPGTSIACSVPAAAFLHNPCVLPCSLRPLFVVLNDEYVVVQALAIRVVGRLANSNPAYVMPALRRHLMQLLNDMDCSPDLRQREGEASGVRVQFQGANEALPVASGACQLDCDAGHQLTDASARVFAQTLACHWCPVHTCTTERLVQTCALHGAPATSALQLRPRPPSGHCRLWSSYHTSLHALRRSLASHCTTHESLPAESAYLLGCLIHSCPRLVMPYVWPILKALVSKLRMASFGVMMPQATAITSPDGSKGPLHGEPCPAQLWAEPCGQALGLLHAEVRQQQGRPAGGHAHTRVWHAAKPAWPAGRLLASHVCTFQLYTSPHL